MDFVNDHEETFSNRHKTFCTGLQDMVLNDYICEADAVQILKTNSSGYTTNSTLKFLNHTSEGRPSSNALQSGQYRMDPVPMDPTRSTGPNF